MTNEELRAYFSSPIYDVEAPYIQKILAGCPDVADPRIVECASAFMQEAEDEGVDMAPADAVKLAKAFRPMPVKDILAKMKNAGIATVADLEKIFARADRETPPNYTGGLSRSAGDKAVALEEMAAVLTKNPDIILLGRPMFCTEMDGAWLKLAVLCRELTMEEQAILTEMHDVADRSEFRIDQGIPKVILRILNVHEK